MAERAKRILVLGLGGAGCNTAARMVPRAPDGLEFAVADCDLRTLETCAHIETRLAAGQAVTNGLSAGGDPDIGRRCAENAAEQLETVLSGTDLLIVIAGLGGGFGSGAAPVVARMARNAGAATLFFTVMPFPYEGTVTQGKAHSALRRLRTYADAIVQMPNALIQPDGSERLADSLDRSSRLLAEGVSGIWRMLARTGLYNLDFASLQAMLHFCDAFCRFACAEAQGEQRAAGLVEALKTHPLLAGTSVFETAPGMIIGITGGGDLRLGEVQEIIEGLTPSGSECWLKTGVTVDSAFDGRIAAVVLAAEAWKEPLADDGRGGLRPASGGARQGELTGVLKQGPRAFGGSERTIWKGEDLDVPAYLRRKLKLPR